MNKNEIIQEIGEKKIVENMVEKLTHRSKAAEINDLSQMVYLVLLEYSDEIIEDMWEKGEIRFLIGRIILNQYRSRTSPFYLLFRDPRVKNPGQ